MTERLKGRRPLSVTFVSRLLIAAGAVGLVYHVTELNPVVAERHCLGLARSRAGEGVDCITRCDQRSPLVAAVCDACDRVRGICIFPVSISGEPVFSG